MKGKIRQILCVSAVPILCGAAALAQGTFGGRVVAGVEAENVIVRIESQNGRLLAQAMTDARGSFRFADQSLIGQSNGEYLYLVVEHEGFLPYRERLEPTQMRGGVLMIYLEPEGGERTSAEGAIDVRQLLADVPQQAVEERGKALEEAAKGNHDKARERLEHAVEIAPDYYDGWLSLGSQYAELGRLDDAKRAYLEAGAVNPNGTLARVNMGVLAYQEGERQVSANEGSEAMAAFADAETWLRQALQLEPDSASAHFYLGATLYRTSRYPEAESELLASIDTVGEHANARLMLINVYARLGQYEAALEQARLFLDENPDSPQREAIERVQSQIQEALGP